MVYFKIVTGPHYCIALRFAHSQTSHTIIPCYDEWRDNHTYLPQASIQDYKVVHKKYFKTEENQLYNSFAVVRIQQN